jgi:hypothetical protein
LVFELSLDFGVWNLKFQEGKDQNPLTKIQGTPSSKLQPVASAGWFEVWFLNFPWILEFGI